MENMTQLLSYHISQNLKDALHTHFFNKVVAHFEYNDCVYPLIFDSVLLPAGKLILITKISADIEAISNAISVVLLVRPPEDPEAASVFEPTCDGFATCLVPFPIKCWGEWAYTEDELSVAVGK